MAEISLERITLSICSKNQIWLSFFDFLAGTKRDPKVPVKSTGLATQTDNKVMVDAAEPYENNR